MKKILLALFALSSLSAYADHCGTECYYEWAKAKSGAARCYKHNQNGDTINGGRPVDDANCDQEYVYYLWRRANNGHIYCYRKVSTEEGILTGNGNKPVDDSYCCNSEE